MQRLRRTCKMVGIYGCMLGLLVSHSMLWAQERKMIDLREKSYSTDELGKALFPESTSDLRTRSIRGIGPQTPTTPPPETSVALNVFFEFNSAAIRQEFHTELDQIGAVLTDPRYQTYNIMIEGHTDSVGSEGYNQQLSERRARSVRDYLVAKFAINPQRLMVHGFGESRPVDSNDSSTGRSKNRRVEVVNRGQ